MAIVTARYWECDVCGYRWPYCETIKPDRCRSKQCRSRRFNRGNVAQPDRGPSGTHQNKAGETRAVAGSSPAVPTKTTKPNWDAIYAATRVAK